MSTGVEQVFELQRMPALGLELLRVLAAGSRHAARPGTELPRWQVRLVLARIEPKRLAAYREVCGLPSGPQLPILYPQVLATPLHLHLMTRRGFPFPVTGLVHVANSFEQSRPLDAGESLGLSARIGPARKVRRGIEFDILTECTDAAGAMPWRSTMTLLHRVGRQAPSPRDDAPAPPPARLARYVEVEVPEDIGRRYARAAQDFNPIHLSTPTARLLGYRAPIAHGMWSAARCLGLLPIPPGGWHRCQLQFRKPLFLPGRAVLRYSQEGSHCEFDLLGQDARVRVAGRLSAAPSAGC